MTQNDAWDVLRYFGAISGIDVAGVENFLFPLAAFYYPVFLLS